MILDGVIFCRAKKIYILVLKFLSPADPETLKGLIASVTQKKTEIGFILHTFQKHFFMITSQANKVKTQFFQTEYVINHSFTVRPPVYVIAQQKKFIFSFKLNNIFN